MAMVLPNEMLLRILTSSILDDRDLCNCSLVCRVFRDLAQPLLFTTFRIKVGEPEQGDGFHTTQAYYERLTQHLSSARRALVSTERFIINSARFRHDDSTPQSNVLPIQICHAVMENLPSFINIVRVELRDLTVPLSILSAVVQLPKLEALVIEGSSFTDVENEPVLVSSPQTLKMLHVNTTHCLGRPLVFARTDVLQWLPALLASPVLEELVCIGDPDLSTVNYSAFLLEAGEIPSLERLTLAFNIRSSSQFTNLIPLYPNLRAFASTLRALRPIGFKGPSVLPEDVLPNITHLEIQLDALEQFEGRKISHLIIELPARCYFPQSSILQHVVARIHRIFPNVVSLQIKCNMCSVACVDLLHSFDEFKHLRQLHISSSGASGGFTPTSPKTKNQRAVNPPLEYFFLDVRPPNEEFDSGIPIADLVPQLTERYSKLNYICCTKRVPSSPDVERCTWMSPGYVPDIESIDVWTSFRGGHFTPRWQWF